MDARLIAAAAAAALVGLASPAGAQVPTAKELADLSLEQLADLEVTSVSKRPERLQDAAASIYVITAEDIRRSGATRLAQALRLAPNLQVARAAANQYAISARGFNNAVGNKLLVLVDGRTVYTPLFSSVFWEAQDVPLEDVERIEVISGPGAALWGINAVNGVINVITRPASATRGTLLAARAGNAEAGATLRHGGALGSHGNYRVYGTYHDFDHTARASGIANADGWRHAQVGFRADWASGGRTFTLQGDTYRGESDHRGFAGAIEITPLEVSGANLLARWSQDEGAGSSWSIQAYVDHSRRKDVVLFGPDATIFDVEAQRGLTLGSHRLLVGGGYRRGEDDVRPGLIATILPRGRALDWINVFVQDQYAITAGLELTAGLKLERNDYTGWEYLPSLRLAWQPSNDQLVWGAASRAVRAPARLDRDVFFPASPPFLISGGPDFRSEVADVLELGYRAQPWPTLHYSITAFVHEWDHLRSGQRAGGVLVNQIEGRVSGVEAWGTWRPLPSWRLSAGYARLDMRLRLEPGSTDSVGVRNANLANDPRHQWSIRSSHDLGRRFELDLMLRRVGALANTAIPAYSALDLRLAWRPNAAWEVSIVAANLTDSRHAEFGNPAAAAQFGRMAYAKAVWRF